MSTNSHSALSNALDILGNVQQDPSSNIIPSAPAVPIDNSNNYIPLFNPAALTINVPTTVTDSDDDDTGDDDNESSFSDIERVLMPPPSHLFTQSLLQRNQRRVLTMRASSHHVNQTVAHAIEETNQSEPGRSHSNTQNTNTRECGICYNQFDIDKIVNTRCNHQFCNKCFFRWMRTNVTCPMCREDFTSWRNHTSDNINNDIIAVTEMFNSTLREHVHLNRLNITLLKDLSNLRREKDQLQNSLVSSRDLIDYNRGYAIGLSSIKRPESTSNKSFDKGIDDGFQEFKSIVRKEKSKNNTINSTTNRKTNKSFKFDKPNTNNGIPIFEFKGFNS